jgi:hypothetical protein
MYSFLHPWGAAPSGSDSSLCYTMHYYKSDTAWDVGHIQDVIAFPKCEEALE